MSSTIRTTCPKCASSNLDVQVLTPPAMHPREAPKRETARFLSPLKTYACKGCGERFTRSW